MAAQSNKNQNKFAHIKKKVVILQRNLGKVAIMTIADIQNYSVNTNEVILTFPRPAQQQSNGNVVKDDPKDYPKINLEKLTDRQRIILYLIRENNTLTISQMTQKLRQKQLK